MIQPRLAVQTLPPYGAPEEGRHQKIRLDFNENTEGFSSATSLGLPQTHTSAYPEYEAITQQLASFYGLQPSQVLLTNGSDEALFLVPFTFIEAGRDAAVISSPTFQMIPQYLTLCGASVVAIPVMADSLAYDIPALEQALSTHQPKLVVLPSPDNPTGATLELAVLQQWLSDYPHTLFVLDQAYGEYEDAASLSEATRLIDRFPNLLLTRTFSKAWGLAGLRLGVLLGQTHLIGWLSQIRSPFSVNTAAVQAVSELLPKAEMVYSQAQATRERKETVRLALGDRGFQTHPGGGNFFLMKLGFDAGPFCHFMKTQGILLRDRSHTPALAGMVRVSVGTQAEMDTFMAAVEAYQQQTILMFDLDDTLVDTSHSFDTVVMDLIQQYSGQPLSREQLYALRSEGGYNDDWVAIRELLKRRGISTINATQIMRDGSRLYFERAKSSERLMIASEHLDALKCRFPVMGIATGRSRQEYQRIWADRLGHWFNAVVCVDDADDLLSKPQPDTLNRCMQLTGTTQGYYLGNAVDDMQAAKNAGLVSIGVVKTLPEARLKQVGARYVLASIEDLAAALQVTATTIE